MAKPTKVNFKFIEYEGDRGGVTLICLESVAVRTVFERFERMRLGVPWMLGVNMSSSNYLNFFPPLPGTHRPILRTMVVGDLVEALSQHGAVTFIYTSASPPKPCISLFWRYPRAYE